VFAAAAAVAAWLVWPAAEVEVPPPPRLAVLPLHADAGLDDLRPLAMGLSVGLNSALGDVSGLNVRSMNAVLPYRDARMPMDSLGRILGVDWLIGGTVNRVDKQIRVSVEVFEALTSRVLATRQFTSPMGREVNLIETMVDDVTTMLRELLGQEVRVTRWRAGTRSADAFMSMARAHSAVSDADVLLAASDITGARERLRFAEASLESAAAADRDWVEPLIEQARVCRKIASVLRGAFGESAADSLRAVIHRGIERANTALQLGDEPYRALEARGELFYFEWFILARADSSLRARAEADLDSASAGDTTLARAQYVRATIHFLQGHYERASVLLEHAYERDAYLEGGRELLTRLYTYNFEAGDDRQARRWCLAFARSYGSEWYSSYCRLELLAWDTTERADVDSAWYYAARGTQAAPALLRGAQGPQLAVLVAGVLARAGKGDSARNVLRRARAAASTDPRGVAEPFASALNEMEASVRLLLRDTAAARSLFEDYGKANPHSVDALKGSRRFVNLRYPVHDTILTPRRP
jgi:TolB-like protein